MWRRYSVWLLIITCGCADKAKEPYEKAQTLDGVDATLDEALELYQAAAASSPDSSYGIKARQRADILEKILSEPPTTVSVAWCARLRRRLESRFVGEALAKDPSRGEAYVRQVTRDFVLNMEYNCRRDAGKPTSGKWLCLWSASFDNYDQCDKS